MAQLMIYLGECVFHLFWMECCIISVRSTGNNVSFKAFVSLLIFCLDDLSTDESGVLNLSTAIVLLSIFPFMAVNICLIY